MYRRSPPNMHISVIKSHIGNALEINVKKVIHLLR